ncbi:dTDP-4-dehydrorhamnose 3,5-epimerase [Aquimarina aquimarini]|uniref:dTDP-4-dehydrorhamnose 3,5-epimerase n=1 Tax=Aquimarina aquimarini TaxID=1191734 RepID=UPI000D554602|nr:dTDP-4-dehydrorhamnose 3,5-epimerase [Aquimarina aquimarini]
MKFIETEIQGLYVIEPFYANDERGKFVKTFHKNTFEDQNIDFNIRETYYSISNKNTIRGLHFQFPPFDHGKLVYVINGSVLDIVVDIRKKSKTFGETLSFELSSTNHKMVYLPTGIAHGFKAIEDNTVMQYNVSTEYNPEADSGILWSSIDFDWDIKNEDLIMSDRDKSFLSLEEFKSPF